MDKRLIEIAKQLQKICKEEQISVYIDVSPYDWDKPILRIYKYVGEDYDPLKPHKTIYQKNEHEINGVKVEHVYFSQENIENEEAAAV
ncbi:hypothetical protein DXT63_08585 [Thermoanaerobacteraceae bacterium SP2]|nr:hypothetical protein DXT63_08585 [Thermoanaerobacteraceae bacterium SP2]